MSSNGGDQSSGGDSYWASMQTSNQPSPRSANGAFRRKNHNNTNKMLRRNDVNALRSNKSSRRKQEERYLQQTYVMGLLLWLLLFFFCFEKTSNDDHLRNHTIGDSKDPPATEAQWERMRAVSQQLQDLLLLSQQQQQQQQRNLEQHTEIMLRLRDAASVTQQDYQNHWNPHNPVHRALSWFAMTTATTSKNKNGDNSSNNNNPVTLQRYAIAVLYYYLSDGVASWSTCCPSCETCRGSEHPVLSLIAKDDKEGEEEDDTTEGKVSKKNNKGLSILSECDWYGVTCGSSSSSTNEKKKGSNNSPESITRQVTRIEWMGNNLSTTATTSAAASFLPPELQLLSNLQLLWLSDNPLVHTRIPSSIQHLTSLESLSLFQTGLAGTLPEELYTLSKLESVRLYQTQLGGPLSPRIAQLSSHLSWLWLHGNQLTGTIPPELGRLTQLEGLTLQDNLWENGKQPPTEICQLREQQPSKKSKKLQHYWVDCEHDDPPSCECCTKCFVEDKNGENKEEM